MHRDGLPGTSRSGKSQVESMQQLVDEVGPFLEEHAEIMRYKVFFVCGTGDPTEQPSEEPTHEPTEEPTAQPTERPTGEPTLFPTMWYKN